MNTKKEHIVFVYNADSGLFNTLSDIAHKIFSPDTYECQLCSLTHTILHEKKDWHEFIESLAVDTSFLHRDQLQDKYGIVKVELPAIFREQEGKLENLVSAVEICTCDTLQDLQALITAKIQKL